MKPSEDQLTPSEETPLDVATWADGPDVVAADELVPDEQERLAAAFATADAAAARRLVDASESALADATQALHEERLARQKAEARAAELSGRVGMLTREVRLLRRAQTKLKSKLR